MADLSLPSSLVRDIVRTFSPLHLLTLSSELADYTPRGKEGTSWEMSGLPSVLRRLLALILLCLKFHFSLDDQFEYYHSHNIEIIRKYADSDLKKANNLQELATAANSALAATSTDLASTSQPQQQAGAFCLVF